MRQTFLATIFVVVVTSAGTAVLLPNQARAQGARGDDQMVVDEIIVTARRRSERLLDVPGTVTALTSAVLESAGVQRAEDFIALTPGVTMVNAAEVGDTQVSIRGINGARDAESSFAYLVDGILYTNPAAFNREYTNLQQIEIFKGPQGAIYGRSAAAGAIIVTTTKPDNDAEFSGRFSFAEDDTYSGDVSYAGPLIEDSVYLRVSANWRNSDGFYRNSFQNDAPIVDAFEGYDINARVIWEVNDSLSIDSKFRIARSMLRPSFSTRFFIYRSLQLPPIIQRLSRTAMTSIFCSNPISFPTTIKRRLNFPASLITT